MLNDFLVEEHVKNALKEDIGFQDVSTEALMDDKEVTAYFKTRADGVVCGLSVVKKVFELLSKDAKVTFNKKDGDKIRKGDLLATVTAPQKCVLTGERTALNYIRYMSGIATETARYIDAMNNPNVRLTDTRKTIPGFRMFEKYSVRTGGGVPHRYNLSDCIMIKDNHIECAGSVTKAIELAKKYNSHAHKIEIECENEEQIKEALKCGVDIIMLDNMPIDEMKKAIALINKQAIVEVSGNVTIETIGKIAAINPDVISTSAIHSGVKPLDIGLDM
ncbi:MAG: carboxylating nicotinate-nucleotide diphosphorylase [Candidatus Gastranaerophilales bacterium]|nr:carboxylating nicotinate-nucleotide diphosphorylase [Candidatus Gastranaerophilales bacterium]